MSKLKKSILSFFVLAILVFFLVSYVRNNLESFSQLSIVTPGLIVLMILMIFFGYFLNGFLNNELLRALKVIMPLSESFFLSIVSGFYNLVTPFRGGMAVRAVYLKKKYNFAYVNFLASLSAVYVLTFLVASFLGIVSTLWIYFRTGMFSWILFLIFDIVFLVMLGIIFVSPQFKERESKWLNRFIKVVNGWHLIKNNKRVILVTSLVTLLQILLGSLMLWLQFRVFGLEISFVAAIFLNAIGSLSLLIGLTPGNLGVQEAIVVFSAATIGISTAEALSAALLGRAVSLVVLFVLGPIFSYVLLKNGSPNKIAKSKTADSQIIDPPTHPKESRQQSKINNSLRTNKKKGGNVKHGGQRK